MPHTSGVAGLYHHPYQSSHPVNTRLDLHIASRDNLSAFTQRVMSAKLLRLKQLQNQLAEAHLQLNELLTENRLLRSLQKRQDLALDRYEGTQAQLPQLVRSHQEEVRVLRTKYKNLKHQYRSVAHTLKEREAELQNIKEQHAHLLKLSKDRNLGERESLTKQVNELKLTVDNQAGTIQVLNRRVLLETKNLKFQLQQEVQRHKSTQVELQQSYIKIDELQTQLDQMRGRGSLPPSMDRFGKTSSLKLTGYKSSKGVTLPQNFRMKTSKESVTPISSNNGSSSVQLDSSPVTLSDKTNEFSVSLDSSPEHTPNEIDTSDTSLPAVLRPNSYEFHRSVLAKPGTDINVNFELSRGRKVMSNSRTVGNKSNDGLEKEYENAMAMLAELSTKHNGGLTDDISTSLATLDLTSAKHVAALANATFALKKETPTKQKSKQDEKLGLSSRTSQETTNDALSISVKSQESPTFEDKMSRKEHSSPVLENLFENIFEKTSDVTQNLETPKLFAGDFKTKHESVSVKQVGGPQKILRSAEDDMDASCKEALLKALKAIDDGSNHGNDSDDSDSAVVKMTTSTMIPQRMFSTLSSSGIGGDMSASSKRGKPFK